LGKRELIPKRITKRSRRGSSASVDSSPDWIESGL
jgi:hypothetical protein